MQYGENGLITLVFVLDVHIFAGRVRLFDKRRSCAKLGLLGGHYAAVLIFLPLPRPKTENAAGLGKPEQ